MDKSYARAPAARTRLLVDEPGALRLHTRQRTFDIADGKRDVMQAFPAGGKESADRRVLPQWLQQLDEGTADGDHRFFNALLLDHLSIQRLRTIETPILLYGSVEISYGDGNVIQVVGEHGTKIVRCHPLRWFHMQSWTSVSLS